MERRGFFSVIRYFTFLMIERLDCKDSGFFSYTCTICLSSLCVVFCNILVDHWRFLFPNNESSTLSRTSWTFAYISACWPDNCSTFGCVYMNTALIIKYVRLPQTERQLVCKTALHVKMFAITLLLYRLYNFKKTYLKNQTHYRNLWRKLSRDTQISDILGNPNN